MNKKSFLRKSLLAILVFSLLVGVFSQKSIAALMYNNTYSTATSAGVASDGTMTIYMAYDGIQGVTYRGEITTYIEKRFLGLFWTRVNIGQPNNQWTDTVYNYRYSGTHSHQLTSSGTYRATVTYKIYGTGGDPDEITSQETVTY